MTRKNETKNENCIAFAKLFAIFLTSALLACVLFAGYVFVASRNSPVLLYSEWTVVADREIIIFHRAELETEWRDADKTDQAEAHCKVLGLELLGFRESILRQVVEQTRLGSFLIRRESGDSGCQVATLSLDGLERRAADCSMPADFICIRPKAAPKIAIGGFGGRRSLEAEWPFFVRIILRGKLVCGGSIFGPYGIVTAAHCIEKLDGPFRLEIEGGVRGRGPLVLDESHPKRALMHPDFITTDVFYNSESATVTNDIGLILSKLSKTDN